MRFGAVLGFSVGVVVVGCSVGVEPEGSTAGELKGGCRWECPKCRPNQPCPMIACHQVCNAPIKCGPATCRAGQVCCNASCGICTEPDSFCTQQACEPVPNGHTCDVIALCIVGYHWSEAQCKCMPDKKVPNSKCVSDGDCRTFSDYCTGCDCRALGTNEADPTCLGPGVRCFADPCMSFTAACVNGSCSLR